ncbi:MAG: ABC transporter permease, partial [Phycisphaeraceae bacterium]|nr:ABC transporter permease [Phycisphaeraceae bacterium]
YIEQLEVPDAFAQNFYPLTQKQLTTIKQADGVIRSSAVTLFPIQAKRWADDDAPTPPMLLYVSCDVQPFVEMTKLTWLAGEPEEALAHMQEKPGLLIGRAFRDAYDAELGDRLVVSTPRGPVEFPVVGIIEAPGLTLSVQLFGIEGAYDSAARSAVVGTREHGRIHFGVDAANLVLMDIEEGREIGPILKQIREKIPTVRTGASRRVIRGVGRSIRRFLEVNSTLALAVLLITSIGVGNLMLAELIARRRDMGILRSVGAGRFLLLRLILAEAGLIAITACLLGTTLGLLLARITAGFHRVALGAEYPLQPAWSTVAFGAGVTIAVALAATVPALISLARTTPRQLLSDE